MIVGMGAWDGGWGGGEERFWDTKPEAERLATQGGEGVVNVIFRRGHGMADDDDDDAFKRHHFVWMRCPIKSTIFE